MFDDGITGRLRQAILLDDLPLIKRILNKHPTYLRNPDFSDKSNTSLHLAAQHGLVEVTELLISRGHDRQSRGEDIYVPSERNLGVSFNTDGQTPLHLAATNCETAVVQILCREFPQTCNARDKEGCTPLHLASKSHPPSATAVLTSASKPSTRAPREDTSTLEVLLRAGADVGRVDKKGNNCLHYATAWGNLKAIRSLIQAGANPVASNVQGWTPEYYSVTVQAEVYYRNLVAEYERRSAEESTRQHDRQARQAAAVRLVVTEDDESEATSDAGRSGADSEESHGTADNENGLGIRMVEG